MTLGHSSSADRPADPAGTGHPVVAFLALVALPALLLLDMGVAALRGWRVQSRIDLGILVLLGAFVAIAALGALAPPTRRLYRRRWAQLCLLSVTTILGLLAAEGLLAIYSRVWAEPVHRHAPHLHLLYHSLPGMMPGVSGESHFTCNSLGIRGPELPADREVYRILCLGGSTTACTYLDDSEAWPQLLMDRLNAAGAKGDYWVGNAGVSSLKTNEHLQFVEQSELMREVDCLVVQAGINDFMRAVRGPEPEPVIWSRSHLPALARRILHLYTNSPDIIVEDRVGSAYERRRAQRQAAAVSDDLPDLSLPLAEFRDLLRGIIGRCRALGVRPVFTSQPVLWRSDLDPDLQKLLWFGRTADGRYLSVAALRAGMDRYNEVVQAVCAELVVEFIDLSAMNGRPEWFYDDCHFNEAGAREVSRRVADWLLKHPPTGRAPSADAARANPS